MSRALLLALLAACTPSQTAQPDLEASPEPTFSARLPTAEPQGAASSAMGAATDEPARVAEEPEPHTAASPDTGGPNHELADDVARLADELKEFELPPSRLESARTKDAGAPAPAPPPMPGDLIIGPIQNDGGVANAEVVIARQRARFRRCFIRALEADPSAQGGVHLELEIAPDGQVVSVKARRSGTFPAAAAACIAEQAKRATFSPPYGERARIVVQITVR